MKAYLATTGAVFALIALLHLLKAIADAHLFVSDPWSYLSMAALGLISAGLSFWAWRLLAAK